MLTRVFKSGNSLAIRIPKELGFVDAAQDVEVERVGNTLVLRLVEQKTLADIGKIFSMFSPNFMAEGREFHEEHERDWGNMPPLAAKAQG
ncbi:AbrB/MazE/SpoVT family DNA-binding domain-containing protein [Rhodoferax sp.]|uniref:antitoxin n=1 Tax=Rhodoferax sp. TaxID=50421 RepID=UPI00283B40FF|nr:AbrB/MazE/SpoVT family DNA-binding domain-containing protein [Rhodoferax sp.]MDR3371134.1 AbrB/MazE/SpoVT family DNA-binding domain-containing protein [Rhodoferax sp.]